MGVIVFVIVGRSVVFFMLDICVCMMWLYISRWMWFLVCEVSVVSSREVLRVVLSCVLFFMWVVVVCLVLRMMMMWWLCFGCYVCSMVVLVWVVVC